jgi:hypothetical protein
MLASISGDEKNDWIWRHIDIEVSTGVGRIAQAVVLRPAMGCAVGTPSMPAVGRAVKVARLQVTHLYTRRWINGLASLGFAPPPVDTVSFLRLSTRTTPDRSAARN